MVLPIAALVAAATFWGVFWYPVRLLDEGGLDGLWTSLVIYASSCAVGAAVALAWRGLPRLRAGLQAGDRRMLALLAIASGWCNVAFILAMLEGNVVRVLLLFYLAPLWTVLLARLFLDEPLGTAARLTLVLAVVGALVMLWDPAIGVPVPRSAADWMALSSGFAFALSNVTVRRLQAVPVAHKSFVAWAGVVLVAGAGIVLTGTGLPQAGASTIGAAVAIGVFGMVLMTLAVVYGITHLPAHRAAVILLFELVIGAVSAQLLTDEPVHANEWVGGALILSAAWFAARAQIADEGKIVHPS